jgi:hypothetical protein
MAHDKKQVIDYDSNTTSDLETLSLVSLSWVRLIVTQELRGARNTHIMPLHVHSAYRLSRQTSPAHKNPAFCTAMAFLFPNKDIKAVQCLHASSVGLILHLEVPSQLD